MYVFLTTLLERKGERWRQFRENDAITLRDPGQSLYEIVWHNGNLFLLQNDIHSPQTTVREALIFSASLRLTVDNLDKKTINAFVDEIMDIVELTPLKGALVGLPGGFQI